MGNRWLPNHTRILFRANANRRLAYYRQIIIRLQTRQTMPWFQSHHTVIMMVYGQPVVAQPYNGFGATPS
jgi:hypothetical protein